MVGKAERTRLRARAVLLVALALFAAHAQDEREKPHLRSRAERLAEMTRLSERNFRRKYRMRRATFDFLLDMIKPYLEKPPRRRGSALGGEIPKELLLGATLRFLAGGSYLDIASDHGMSQATLYASVWEVLAVIDKVLDNMTFKVDDATFLEEKRELMSHFWGDSLYGCVGAIDGWACRIARPNEIDAATYYNRKGFYAIVVQALVDGARRFMHFVDQARCILLQGEVDLRGRGLGSQRSRCSHELLRSNDKAGSIPANRGLRWDDRLRRDDRESLRIRRGSRCVARGRHGLRQHERKRRCIRCMGRRHRARWAPVRSTLKRAPFDRKSSFQRRSWTFAGLALANTEFQKLR